MKRLDEDFYKKVRIDMKKYSNDPKMAIERSKMIEKLERERIAEQAEAYEILSEMGPISGSEMER